MRADLDHVLRRPGPAAALLIVGVLAGFAIGSFFKSEPAATAPSRRVPPSIPGSGSPTGPGGGKAPQSSSATGPTAQQRRSLVAAMRVAEAALADRGKVAIAVQLDDWTAPVARGRHMRFRMWSAAKVLSAISLYSVKEPSQYERMLVKGALTRSENCKARSVLYALQQERGASPDGTLDAVRGTLTLAGTNVLRLVELPTVGTRIDGCDEETTDQAERAALVPQLGTAKWSIEAAVEFMRALGRKSSLTPIRKVLHIMALPKDYSRESPRTDQHANPNWGLGEAYANVKVPYKGGWGGFQPDTPGNDNGPYVAEQIGIVPAAPGHWASVAIAYEPTGPVLNDDPGDAGAPEAYAAILGRLKPAIEALP